MKGDDRVRFCEQCQRNVYNLSRIPSQDIDALLVQREGRLCGRFHQRPDGTMLTKNCPVGFRAALTRSSGLAAAALSALLSLVPAAGAQSTQKSGGQTPSHPRMKPSASAVYLQIVDDYGGVIVNAQITLRNESTNAVQDEKSNAEGEVRIAAIAKGKYEVTITSPGFRTLKLEHVDVPNPELRIVKLEVSVMGQVVIVSHSPVKRFFSKLRHIG